MHAQEDNPMDYSRPDNSKERWCGLFPPSLWRLTLAVSRASSRSDVGAKAVGVGSSALILIEAPSPATPHGMLIRGQTYLPRRRRPQCDFTPLSTHFTAY